MIYKIISLIFKYKMYKGIEYICIAQCSDKCIENPKVFKTHICKKLKTYNKCDKCNIYVCEECSKMLENNKINYCLICRKTQEDVEDVEDVQHLEEVSIKNKICLRCYEKIKYGKCNIILRIKIFFKELYYFLKESKCCNNICFLLGFIFVPLTVSLIFHIFCYGFDSISDIFSSDENMFITIILLYWLYGFMFSIIVFHIYVRCFDNTN